MSTEEKAPKSEHLETVNRPAAAQEGHGATRFEPGDARASMVIWSLVVIAGTLVVVFAITLGIQQFLYDRNPQGELPSPLAPERVLPPNPHIEVHPWEDLPKLREHEDRILNGYGSDAAGRLHIPIDRAMDAVVPRLKIRADAPTGITTPGGEGRDFGGNRGLKRAPYRIEIKAEGEVHAK